MDRNALQEVLDRTRRIETRLTRYLTEIGFDTGARKPDWLPEGVVEVHSPATSLTDILSVVPDEWEPDLEVAVRFRGQHLGWVCKPWQP